MHSQHLMADPVSQSKKKYSKPAARKVYTVAVSMATAERALQPSSGRHPSLFAGVHLCVRARNVPYGSGGGEADVDSLQTGRSGNRRVREKAAHRSPRWERRVT